MRSVWRRLGMRARISLAAVLPAVAVLVVMGAATLLLSRDLFERLMVAHGASAAEAGAMFEQTVGFVAIGALAVGAVTAAVAAWLLTRNLVRPIGHLADAAKRLESGALDARVGDLPDVPELAALATAFDAMAAALEKQEQVRRDFVTGAAHELLTPLTNLEGYLEGMRDGVVEADRATLESLLEESRRLSRLSRALLETAPGPSGDGGRRVVVDVRRSVLAATALMEPTFANRGITVEVDAPAGLSVSAVPDRLTQVLFNLLHNAGRYAARGSEVLVRAESTNGAVRVSVINSGDPIPSQIGARVFERFFRVDASRDRATGGAGIGLAIVKEIVEGAGGKVGVEPDGARTRFWFSLPAAR